MVKYAALLILVLSVLGDTVFGQKQSSEGDTLTFYAAEPFVEYLPPNIDVSSLQKADKLSAFATPGQFEPLTCAMYSREGISNVLVTASDLKSGESTIPADRIDLRIVKYWFRTGSDWKGRFLIPDPLFHNDNLISVDIPKKENVLHFKGLPVDSLTLAPFSLPAGTVKQLWITIHVPEQAKAGVYQGHLTFNTDNNTPVQLPVQFEVLPFKLDSPNKEYHIWFPSEIRAPGDKVRNVMESTVSEEVYRAQCADLQAHGILFPSFSLPVTERDDGTLDFTYTRKMMAIREKYGLNKGTIFIIGAGNPSTALRSPDAMEHYINRVRQIVDFFRINGWDTPCFFADDEVHGENLSRLKPVLKKIREAGGKVGYGGYTNNQTARLWNEPGWLEITGGQFIDLVEIAQHLIMVPVAEINKSHSLGIKYCFYAMPQTIWFYIAPYEFRNNYGFWLFSSPADGVSPWGYQWVVAGNPYDAFDSNDSGPSCCAVYPTKDGVVPTILWEAVRGGIDDCRYASTLYNLIVRAKAFYGNSPVLRETEDWMKRNKVEYIPVLQNYSDPNYGGYNPDDPNGNIQLPPDPNKVKCMLVYGKDLKRQIARRPNLQALRRGYVKELLKLKEKYPDL